MARLGALVAAGRTSDVYEFGKGAVVKVPRPLVPDHWAALEASFTAALRHLDVPAPSVIDLTEIGGRHAIVFERIEGRTMWQHMLEHPDQVSSLARTLAETHRRILSAGPPAGLDGLVDRMRRKLTEADELSDAERAEATQLVERLPKGAALLHGDLHPGNVLMTPAGPVAIDWFDASIGHPVADVVRSSLLMRDQANPPHLPAATPGMLTQLHHSYIQAMADVLDMPVVVLRQWEAVRAASRLSEGAQAGQPMLVELWRARHGNASSALLDALMTLRSVTGTPG